MATYVVLPWLLSPRRMRESGNGHGLFVFERPLRSPWKHVKEPPRALWIAARAPKFLYHMSIRDKKSLLFMSILKWIDSFTLSPIRINKHKSITFFKDILFRKLPSRLTSWFIWNRSRRDNGEVEMNEIQATTMSGFIELLLFWERELEELDKIPLNFCSVKCVFLHPAFSGD